MNGPDSTEHRTPSAEELVCWTGRERLRFLWYRLRLPISDINWLFGISRDAVTAGYGV